MPRPDATASAGPALRKEFLLFAADLAVCAGSMGLAMLIRFAGDVPPLHLLLYLYFLPVLIALRLLMAANFGLYDFRRRLTATDHVFGGFGAASLSVGIGYLLLVVVDLYYLPVAELSRLVVALDLVILFVWFALSRAAVLLWLRASGQRVRVLLTGPAAACRELAEEMAKYAPRLIEVAGTIALDEDDTTGDASSLQDRVAHEDIHQIILVHVDLPQDELRDLLAQCDRAAVEIFLYPGLNLSILSNTAVMSIAGLPLISLRPAFERSPYRRGKRLLDIAAALILLLPLSPLCVIAAAAVKLGSRGPVFFSQERVGYHGEPFRVLKYRTMVPDAEAESGPVLSTSGDPRVTPLGRILRRTRFDEVPQLWNVLRGDMSLIGPRPERRDFFDRFVEENPLYERRVLVKPGLTGLAQIHGRYDTDYTHKLRYDLIYINSISLATDLRILIATIRTVVTGKGAV